MKAGGLDTENMCFRVEVQVPDMSEIYDYQAWGQLYHQVVQKLEEGRKMSTSKAVTLLYSLEVVTYPAACSLEAYLEPVLR